MANPTDRPKVLVIQLRQLGDILLTTPLIRAIKKKYPKGHVACLTHPMGKLVLDGSPYLDRHFVYPPEGGLLAELKLARELRREGFDWVIDGMNNPRSALYAAATGAPRRIAFQSSRRVFYTDVLEKKETYIVKEKLLLAAPLGISESGDGISLDLPWDSSHTGPASAFFADRQKPVVILSPTHRREPRRWPLASYARLAEWLVDEKQATVMWAWGPGEESVIDEVQGLTRGVTHKAPKTSFREMAALFARADLFIGNSNGPSHVAVSVDLPSIQLHGHTNLISWCPMTERHRGLQTPGFGKISMPPISDISLDEVKDLVCAMWPNGSPPRL